MRAFWLVIVVAGLVAGTIGVRSLVEQERDRTTLAEESFGTVYYEPAARQHRSRSQFVASFADARARVESSLGPVKTPLFVHVVPGLTEQRKEEYGDRLFDVPVAAQISFKQNGNNRVILKVSASTATFENLVVALTRVKLLETKGAPASVSGLNLTEQSALVENGIGLYLANLETEIRSTPIWMTAEYRFGRFKNRGYEESKPYVSRYNEPQTNGWLLVHFLKEVKGWSFAKIVSTSKEEIEKEIPLDHGYKEKYTPFSTPTYHAGYWGESAIKLLRDALDAKAKQ